jgi:hypothetical protein
VQRQLTIAVAFVALLAFGTGGIASGCAKRHASARAEVRADAQASANQAIRRTAATEAARHYRFTADDEALLEEIQHACFLFFWNEVGRPSELAKDRMKGPVASVASVGFQLSSLPIGVEHGWITREQGEQRARTALQSLVERSDNKRFGLYLHFVDLNSGGLSGSGYEVLVSTVDSALLMAGAITAGEYFGGDVKRLVDRMIADANWDAFAQPPSGFLSMGWGPDDKTRMDGPGTFHRLTWHVASDEERIVYFLAVGSPNPKHAVPAEVYYRLKRVIKRHGDLPPYAVSPQGTLFHYFFSHCWIDYGSLGLDRPDGAGVKTTPIDWFENSRRAVLTHRRRCIEQRQRFKTLSENRWGLSACAGRDGYLVPEVQPNIIDKDNFRGGTVAPYAAGASIMFTPSESLTALRTFRALQDDRGRPMAWRDPAAGGYGFVDSFNLDQRHAQEDFVGIDQGPLLLGIENARTGLVWRLFMQSETARLAVRRLQLETESPPPSATRPAS